MQWVVLGSGTAVPSADRGCASHLLQGDGKVVLFDSGSGTKDRLARSGVRLGDLSHIIYTHAHLDHWADLLSLLFYRAHAPAQDRAQPFSISGPPGFVAHVQCIARLADPDLLDGNPDLVWTEVRPGEVIDGGWFRAIPHAVEHGRQVAQAYRIEGGDDSGQPWSVAYSGDTGACDGLLEAARNVDCLVCECSFPAHRGVASHLSPESVRRVADEARPGVLVLTHLYPEVLEAGVPGSAFDGYGGRVMVAFDGLSIPLGQSE